MFELSLVQKSSVNFSTRPKAPAYSVEIEKGNYFPTLPRARHSHSNSHRNVDVDLLSAVKPEGGERTLVSTDGKRLLISLMFVASVCKITKQFYSDQHPDLYMYNACSRIE